MTRAAAQCSPNTRLAGLLSALVATATFWYLQVAYERLPLLVPIAFDAGNPSQFALKSPELVYLPFGLQLVLGGIFAAVVAMVLLLREPGETEGADTEAVARHTAEGVALLAAVWIAFQGVNAWRLTELWRRTYDANIEAYAVALITALTLSVVIGLRVVMQIQDADGTLAPLHAPVLNSNSHIATAGLAAILAAGIALPLYLLSVVWGVLRQF